MKDIEKNDVDISQLFIFKRELELTTPDDKKVVIYIRLPNDSDVGRARVKAIRESSDFRAKLRDKKWEDREVYIPDVSELSKDELIKLIQSYSVKQIGSEITNEIDIPIPKELKGDSTLEEQEEYQKRIDDYPKLVNAKILTELTKRINLLEKFLQKKTKTQLVTIHERELIREVCDGIFSVSFRQRCAYYGSYKDENYKTLLFGSYEKFDESPSILKEQILNTYVSLELGSEALKKLQGVTL